MRVKLQQVFLASTMLAFGGLAAGGAFAAAGDPAPPTASGVPDQKSAGAANADMRTMQQRVEKRITQLHSSLRITAAQQPQWDAFVRVMRDNAQQMDSAVVTDATTLARMTAVDQMASYAKISAQHAKDVQSILPAFKSLYDVMSPEQKANADSYFRANAERRHGKKA